MITNDEYFISQAIELAQKAYGMTSPNPLVGAILIRDGKIIGRGWHKKAGTDHAEIVAIKDALKKKNAVKGATLYVNLEPCCHFGSTPPCCNALVEFGIKKVVIAHKDPSRKVNGRGILFLKKHGIEVVVGVCEEKARMINQPFIKSSLVGRPFVTLKAGISLDGKIATRSGKSEWITNELSRTHGKNLRNGYDAIVVGANTVKIDDPILGAKNKILLRVIFDGKLSSPPRSRVFRDDNVVVVYTAKALEKNIREFKKAGIKIIKIGKEFIDVKKFLELLYEDFGVQSVFVEGGGTVHGAFVDAKCVDDVYLYISPEIIGGRDAVSVVSGLGAKTLKDSLKIKKLTIERLNSDILIHGIVKEY